MCPCFVAFATILIPLLDLRDIVCMKRVIDKVSLHARIYATKGWERR